MDDSKKEQEVYNAYNGHIIPHFDTENSEIPEWLKKIRPDYSKIGASYLMISFMGSIFALIMQIVLFCFFKFNVFGLQFKISETLHLFCYFIIPAMFNLGGVLIAFLLRRLTKNDIIISVAPVFSTYIVCSSVCIAHSVYPATMLIMCLPVFMVAAYGIKRLLYIMSGASMVSLGFAVMTRALSPYRVGDTALIPEAIIAFAILIVSVIISYTMIMLFQTQKGRLISSTKSAHQATKEAQAANKAKSEFLANMSHEIRTPLNTVTGMTEMIIRRTDSEEIREYAGDIQQASNALLAIINDILDISKIESGRMELHESDYELGSLINDSYNMVATRWKEKGLSATVVCDPGLPRVLCGDEYHLRQILVNLLSNAVKYTNNGGVELRVSGEQNNDILRLELFVKDTGMGIKQEDIPKLFNKFSRLELAKNRNIEGTGLGLSITKQLVDLMNGTITVESVYGVGSTFIVRIPQKIVDRTPIGDIHATYLDLKGELEQYTQSFEAPEAKILAVDDVYVNLAVIKKLLEATKVKVDIAGSGAECLEMIAETEYDVILMDHMMPRMDGVQTLRAMKELKNNKNTDTPIIMLTANAMLGAREEYIGEGFIDYLAKPVRGAKLEQMLIKYLPQNKVTLLDVREHAQGREKAEPTSVGISSLEKLLPELDKAAGLMYCAGDESFYISMLKEFVNSARDKALCAAYEAGDWKTYQIEAHSLKSSAKMVGLTGLSDESAGLEQAAKDGDTDYIAKRHADVVAHFAAVTEVLSKLE